MFVKTIRYYFFFFLAGTIFNAVAQPDTTLIQEVEVVKSYRPVISDANKISSMPQIEDQVHQKPTFSYSIFSQPVYNVLSVNTLKAATFVSEPGAPGGLGLVRAGVGNYNRPYGELFFNSQNIRNTLFGLHGRHLSSHGRLKLEGGDLVDAPFSENSAEMFIKHLTPGAVLSINAGFDHNGFNYYGYPVDPIPLPLFDTGQPLNFLGSRQTFSKGSFNIGLVNAGARKNDLTFDFNFLYHYFGTKTGQREHFAEFMTDIVKPYHSGKGYLKAGITYVHVDSIFNRHLMAEGMSRQTWLTAQPSYMLGGEMANIRMGLNTWFVLDSHADIMAKIAPVIRVNFVPVKDLITIFAGLDGNYINNHYSKIAGDNPFVNPKHHVKNTLEQFHFYGGFNGKLAAKTNFKISVDYSVIKDQPFYYLFKYQYPYDGNVYSVVDNDFQVIYDNFKQTKFNIEVFHATINRANLLLAGNYYVYNMETIEEPWSLPNWDARLSLGYHVSDQLSFSTDLIFTGQRTALILSVPYEDPRIPNPLTNPQLLDLAGLQWEHYNQIAIVDLNLNINYKLTNRFSLFGQLNNFGFQKYQRWLGYPVQSYNLLGGLSYSF